MADSRCKLLLHGLYRPTGSDRSLNDIGEALTENVPDSYRMGVELMLGIKPCKWFQWDINATWSKNRIQNFGESLPGYHYNDDGSSTSLPTVQIKHKDTHIAFSPDFLFNNRFSFIYKGFEAALQSQFVSKQYMTNAEVEALTLDKYFVSNLNLAYSFRPKKVLKEVTVGFTVYNLFNEKYENNGWASSDYTDRWRIGETMPDMQRRQEQTLWDMFLSAFNTTGLWN